MDSDSLSLELRKTAQELRSISLGVCSRMDKIAAEEQYNEERSLEYLDPKQVRAFLTFYGSLR